MKKIEKPLVEENAPTNGGGRKSTGSGVSKNGRTDKRKFKLTKPTIIIIAMVLTFTALIILL